MDFHRIHGDATEEMKYFMLFPDSVLILLLPWAILNETGSVKIKTERVNLNTSDKQKSSSGFNFYLI